MTSVEPFAAYTAFEKQLRTLCLKEFPCGSGNWRESNVTNVKLMKTKDKVDSKFPVTLKDYGAEHEKTETLQEYVSRKRSPWHLDYSWSEEAKQLREIAVKSPWLIDDNFVLNYFKTLRIVDKNVTEVDGNLLKFKNLEELTLSANYLKTVNSKNLPTSLQVLELCANQISDLSALCVRPCPLIHLGLGFNKISFIGDYLTGDFWPFLLSLDLSNNNLSDLCYTKLGSLPKLRNLILQGNPLSLIAGYRGYTIDSLRKLSILDDIMISADEKHHYKGLARRREYILDEAKVTLGATFIKGVPMPEELKNPEEQPEYPIIERKYFVQFMFLQDSSQKAEVFQLDHGELSPIPSEEQSQFTSHPELVITFRTEQEVQEEVEPSLQSETVKNVNFTANPEVVNAQELTGDHEHLPVIESVSPSKQDGGGSDQDEKPSIQIAPVNSEGGHWSAEEIELNWSQVVVRDDLLSLRNFFKQGMNFSVIEEMTEAYPAEESAEEGSAGTPSSQKKGKDKTKKEEKPPPPKGGKDKKKKKEPEIEMKKSPPVFTTLATWHIPMEDFLEGEYEFQHIFSHGGVEVASTVKSADISDPKKKKDKDKKKPDSGKKDKGKEPRRPSAGKQGKDDKGKEKGGKGGKGVPPPVDEEGEEAPPPPPLEVQVSVRLHHWKTALDSLKEEQEKIKEQEEQQAQQ
ncbi:LOW QUALITY PROTEIN: hypothetical protein KUTeg_010396 [Tegillarca granosa]|uniref:Leucine-rich repeat-containing protein 43 n=1 Tax=Tegillarca granosa TaxID=220873 RepID=A0ABQ9F6N6_TEGGR|nr:LOW QUALITY PROTEIN: hypothetical protein KUTeg_010396 [Tegillarca granosa]